MCGPNNNYFCTLYIKLCLNVSLPNLLRKIVFLHTLQFSSQLLVGGFTIKLLHLRVTGEHTLFDLSELTDNSISVQGSTLTKFFATHHLMSILWGVFFILFHNYNSFNWNILTSYLRHDDTAVFTYIQFNYTVRFTLSLTHTSLALHTCTATASHTLPGIMAFHSAAAHTLSGQGSETSKPAVPHSHTLLHKKTKHTQNTDTHLDHSTTYTSV